MNVILIIIAVKITVCITTPITRPFHTLNPSCLDLPQIRFDAATNEIVLSSNRYPSREENRRLCLEQLHLLLREGLPGGQLPVDSAFLRETRVKSKDR